MQDNAHHPVTLNLREIASFDWAKKHGQHIWLNTPFAGSSSFLS